MDQKVRFWGIRIILRVECGGWQEEKDQEVPLRCIRVLTHDSWSKEVSAFSGTDPVLWSRVVWDLAGGSAWELWLPFLWGKGHISGLFSIQTKLCLSISSSMYVFVCWPVDKQEHIEALHMEWPQLDVVMLPALLSYVPWGGPGKSLSSGELETVFWIPKKKPMHLLTLKVCSRNLYSSWINLLACTRHTYKEFYCGDAVRTKHWKQFGSVNRRLGK